MYKRIVALLNALIVLYTQSRLVNTLSTLIYTLQLLGLEQYLTF